MKMLKRAGAIAIAGAMALTLGSVAYAADPTITVGDINIGEADENGIVTVTVPYTAENLADGAQVTLLAELGAAEKAYASNIVYDTTAYIDQDAAGSAFTFKINENRLTGTKDADVWLNVKVGGTGVAKAAEGSVQAYDYVEAPKTPITSEEVKGALEVDSENAVVTGIFDKENIGIMRLDASTLVSDGKLDLTKQLVTIDNEPAYYTEYNGKIKLIAAVDTTKETHNVVITDSTDEVAVATTKLLYGDATRDGAISVSDYVPVLQMILATDFSAYDAITLIAADGSGDKNISVSDYTPILQSILDSSYVPAADK